MTTDRLRSRRYSIGALIAVGLLLAACGSSQSAESPGSVDGVPARPVAPAPPTGGADPGLVTAPVEPDPPPQVTAAPETTTWLLCSASSATWDISGHEALVRTPQTSSAVGLIVALHGYKGTPEGLEYYSELTTAAESGEAVVAYLSGGTALDLGFGWNSGSSRFATTSGDDIAYIAAALELLVALPCVDESNVSLVGESNGGGMAVRAVCDARLSGRVHRLVLVNAAVDDGVLSQCSNVDPPVEILATAGLVDSVVPADGSRDPFLSVDNWFRRVAIAAGGCDSVASSGEPSSESVTSLVGQECARCVTMLEVADGGHTWPGSFEGVNNHAVGALEFTAILRNRVQEAPAEQNGPAGECRPNSVS